MDFDSNQFSDSNDLHTPSQGREMPQEIGEAELVDLLGSPLRVRSRVVAVDRIIQDIQLNKSERTAQASAVDFDRQFDKTYCDDYDRVYSQSIF